MEDKVVQEDVISLRRAAKDAVAREEAHYKSLAYMLVVGCVSIIMAFSGIVYIVGLALIVFIGFSGFYLFKNKREVARLVSRYNL